jgi:hypothetical protein
MNVGQVVQNLKKQSRLQAERTRAEMVERVGTGGTSVGGIVETNDGDAKPSFVNQPSLGPLGLQSLLASSGSSISSAGGGSSGSGGFDLLDTGYGGSSDGSSVHPTSDAAASAPRTVGGYHHCIHSLPLDHCFPAVLSKAQFIVPVALKFKSST